jgi:DNA-binding transcriptional LysR family regulator
MNYTLNQLRIFLKVVQTESITKASEELHLTQPAVSIQLRNFQEQFEIPLTEIIGKKIFITDFGREIGEAAESILNEVYAINHKVNAYKGHLTGRLKISVASTGKYVIPYILSPFLKKYQNIELMLDVTNKTKVIESLIKNEVDFALVSVIPEKMNFQKIKLMPNKLFLVGNKEKTFNPVSNDKSILESIPLIFREEGSATRDAMEKYIDKIQLTGVKKMEFVSNETIKQAIISGLGYSIMPMIGLRNELSNDQLQIIPMDGLPICTDWYLIYLENKKLSPIAKAFVDFIETEKENIIEENFSWVEKY